MEGIWELVPQQRERLLVGPIAVSLPCRTYRPGAEPRCLPFNARYLHLRSRGVHASESLRRRVFLQHAHDFYRAEPEGR